MAAAVCKNIWKRIAYWNAETDAPADAEEKRRGCGQEQVRAEDKLTSVLGPFESYVVNIQSILIWENPLTSTLAFLAINVLFWVIVNCQSRFYFVLAALSAVTYVYRTWVNHIWPEIRVPLPEGEDTEAWTPVHPRVLSVPEISRYVSHISDFVEEWFAWFIDLRHEHPGKFCILVTSLLAAATVLGHYISGVLLVYIAVLVAMLGPGFMLHTYPQISRYFAATAVGDNASASENVVSSDRETAEPDELDEFLPEITEENINVLANALESQTTFVQEEESLIFARDFGLPEFSSYESGEILPIPSSLSQQMPSYDKDSDDELDLHGFVPQISGNKSIKGKSHGASGAAIMQFVSSHFDDADDDYSDEDSDPLAPNANFDEGGNISEDVPDSRLLETEKPEVAGPEEPVERESGEASITNSELKCLDSGIRLRETDVSTEQTTTTTTTNPEVPTDVTARNSQLSEDEDDDLNGFIIIDDTDLS